MSSLRVIICLLGLVGLCQCDCFFQELVLKNINNPPKRCVDKDGKLHDFGSQWVNGDCYECSCTAEGLSCCSKIPDFIDAPGDCEVIVNREACSAKMVLKSDHTKECSATAL